MNNSMFLFPVTSFFYYYSVQIFIKIMCKNKVFKVSNHSLFPIHLKKFIIPSPQSWECHLQKHKRQIFTQGLNKGLRNPKIKWQQSGFRFSGIYCTSEWGPGVFSAGCSSASDLDPLLSVSASSLTHILLKVTSADNKLLLIIVLGDIRHGTR